MKNKEITILHTTDDFDCDDCGGSYAESWQLIHGDKVYGERARAHCFGETSTQLGDVLLEFLQDEGYVISNESEHYYGDEL
jgi:hypothetical protein